MPFITLDAVRDALRRVDDPDLGRDIVSLGMVRDLTVCDGKVALRVVLTTPACPMKDQIRGEVEAALRAIGVEEADIVMDAEVRQVRAPRPGAEAGAEAGPPALHGVRTIIAVASGKGGVGKSTVAVNLAITLSRVGARVGLLDADIYGPSLGVMLGMQDIQPMISPEDKMLPAEVHGLRVMSMSLMIRDDDAVMWRGPMLGRALEQLLRDVDWGELDYLVVDMPPGTGDVQLSLAQLVPVTGVIVVTTPQDVAFADVRRAIKMFGHTRIPILGIVENMSTFHCDGCGKVHEIFGPSRVAEHAAEVGLKVLGRLPLDAVTSVEADKGRPVVLAAPDSAATRAHLGVAQLVSQQVSLVAFAAREAAPFEGFYKPTGQA